MFKQIHKMLMLQYIGPFLMTFAIALFILLMQFVWKYIDDFVGKGLEWHVFAKLMFFATATFVPLALPLAVLLSSIMTYGNLAEHYELVACKSAGISLQRVMAPLVIVSILISSVAFLFSNYMMPYASLKMGSLLYDIRQQKPALAIKPGVFNNGIEGYSIKVASKDEDGVTIHGVIIYDHKQGTGNSKVTLAEKGTMLIAENSNMLIVTLYNGSTYEEQSRRNTSGINTHPAVKSSFKEQVVRFDLSNFKLSRTNEELFKNSYQMMNVSQLEKAKDSINKELEVILLDYRRGLGSNYNFLQDTLRKRAVKLDSLKTYKGSYLVNIDVLRRNRAIDMALSQARNIRSFTSGMMESIKIKEEHKNRCGVEWHLKFTLSAACFILFFIGAPLGAIIRKGGLGLPAVVATLFFILFHILTITGRKLAQEGRVPVMEGMWAASVLLLPIGIFLTYKATTDSALFDRDAYFKFANRVKGFFSKRTKTAV